MRLRAALEVLYHAAGCPSHPSQRLSRLDGCDGMVAWLLHLLEVGARTPCCAAGRNANLVSRLVRSFAHDAGEAAVHSYLL